ncbi:hypothetical protein AQAU111925_10065 [Aquirufa aurantiipilula]
MREKSYFTCDNCHNKISFWETFKTNKNSKTICNFCNTELHPIKTISFNWSFFIGFISTVIPAEIVLKYYNSVPIAFFVALCGGILSVLGIAFYTYKSTELKS